MSDLRMPDLNKVLIAGRLTRDPELKYTASGKPYCRMSIANSRRFKTQGSDSWQEETNFIDVQVWGPQAEYTGQKLHKGNAVIVEGRLRSNEWEDKQSGQKRQRLEVLADRVSPLEWHGEGGGARQGQAAPQGQGYGSSRPAASSGYGGRQQDDYYPDHAEDDIPF